MLILYVPGNTHHVLHCVWISQMLSIMSLPASTSLHEQIVNETSEFVQHMSFDIMLQFHFHSIPYTPKKC